MMTRCCMAVVLLLFAVFFASAQSPSESATGIEGVITISPVQPGPVREAARNIDIERPATANSDLAAGGNRVVTRHEDDPEMSLRVGRERSHRALLIGDREITIGKRRRTRDAFPHRSRLNRADCDYAFNAGCRFRG